MHLEDIYPGHCVGFLCIRSESCLPGLVTKCSSLGMVQSNYSVRIFIDTFFVHWRCKYGLQQVLLFSCLYYFI